MSNINLEELSTRTNISIKNLNYLNKNKWYHGTTIENYENIKHQGVLSTYNIGTELDFGVGFYLTDKLDAASKYMERLPEVMPNGIIQKRKKWCVIEFEFNPFKLLFETKNNYRFKNFSSYNNEFAEFIFENRLYNVFNEKPHGIDIIWGVMSDSFPRQIMMDYRNNKITRDEAIEKFKKGTSMKQLYIGNQNICNKLCITNIIEFEGGEKDETK